MLDSLDKNYVKLNSDLILFRKVEEDFSEYIDLYVWDTFKIDGNIFYINDKIFCLISEYYFNDYTELFNFLDNKIKNNLFFFESIELMDNIVFRAAFIGLSSNDESYKKMIETKKRKIRLNSILKIE